MQTTNVTTRDSFARAATRAAKIFQISAEQTDEATHLLVWQTSRATTTRLPDETDNNNINNIRRYVSARGPIM